MEGLGSETKMPGYQLVYKLGMMGVHIEVNKKHKSTIVLLTHVPTSLCLPGGDGFPI